MRKKKKRRGCGTLLLVLFSIAVVIVGIGAMVNHYYPLRYIVEIKRYANEYSLKPEFVCAVIHAESRFNKDAVSEEGASGLMQIIESTAYWLAPKLDMEDFDYSQIFDPDINIRMGCYYLNLLDRQYDDTDTALCAYNAGSGNVDMWLNDPEYSSDGKKLDSIPFLETQDYIKRVTDNQKIYSIILKIRDAPIPLYQKIMNRIAS